MTGRLLSHRYRRENTCVQRQRGIQSEERVKATVLILRIGTAMVFEAKGVNTVAMNLLAVVLFTVVGVAMIVLTVGITVIVLTVGNRADS